MKENLSSSSVWSSIGQKLHKNKKNLILSLIHISQQSNGYDITLLGLVSGEKLELCVPQETRENVSKSHTYEMCIRDRVNAHVEN